jgi:hypothetical protein
MIYLISLDFIYLLLYLMLWAIRGCTTFALLGSRDGEG